jgi:hypothetical protein
MIKSTAAAKSDETSLSKQESNDNKESTNATNKHQTKQPAAPNKSKWSALQDDYMLNSKLKDWDKESSDEEEGLGGNEDWASDDEQQAAKEQPAKKRRVSSQ